jgi:hypothetical protein
MNEQNEQFEPMNVQPDEELTTQDIVSAARRKDDVKHGAQQPDAGRSAKSQPAQQRVANAGAPAYAGGGSPGPGGPGAAPTRAAAVDTPSTTPMPLLANDAADAFQARWDAIQTAFVDEPRQVVEQADGLVAEVMQQLAATFARERASLERQWDRGGDVSTEDLRLALQRYRSFFQRLLSA